MTINNFEILEKFLVLSEMKELRLECNFFVRKMEEIDPKKYISETVVDNYPVFRLPNQFRQTVIEGVKKLLEYPVEPEKPLRPASPTSLTDYITAARLLVFLFLIVIVGQFATASYPMVNEGQGILVSLLLMAISGIVLRRLKIAENEREHSFREKMKLYNHELERYEKDLENHKRKIKEIKLARQIVKIHKYPISYAISIYLKRYLSEVSKPTRIERVGAKGKAELKFGNHLRSWFGEKILDSHTIDDRNLIYPLRFEPDFVYHDEARCLSIAIEVDEPYGLIEKTPIHVYADIGSFREKHFLEQKWFIVRFSEEQVVRDPEACCKEIACFVYWLTAMHTTALVFDSAISFLSPTATWSYEDAQKMAKARKREGYL